SVEAAKRASDKDGVLADREEAASQPMEPGTDQPPQVEPVVRKNFADTALWAANITTDKNGVAQVDLTMPENLTTWKTKVWSMSSGTRCGQGDSEVTTYKDLIVRLQ